MLRQWEMLRLLPRYPGKITARQLQERLQTDGYPAAKRTIERDLIELSEVFPLTVDDRDKPYGWSWVREAPGFNLPGLTPDESLAIALVGRFLEPLLPRQVFDALQPYFVSAERVLANLARPGKGGWLRKIRAVPASQPLIAPVVPLNALAAVSDALLRERQLEVRYLRHGEKKAAELRVHPLALVQRGPVLYLVCTVYKYSDVRLLAMHRIRSADVTDEAAGTPDDFDIDRYIASGALGFGSGRRVRLEAIFRDGAGQHLYETPIDRDQKLLEIGEGAVKLVATLPNTAQLRWWLLGFGDRVEIASPASLRREFREIAGRLLRLYR